jgi:hypothetical protein
MKLSVSRASRPLPSGRFLVLIFIRGWVDPRAIVRLEGLGQLQNPITSSGIEHASFPLEAKCLNFVNIWRKVVLYCSPEAGGSTSLRNSDTFLPHCSSVPSLYALCNEAASVWFVDQPMGINWWMMISKRSGMKRSWPDRVTIPEFFWRNRGTPQETSTC